MAGAVRLLRPAADGRRRGVGARRTAAPATPARRASGRRSTSTCSPRPGTRRPGASVITENLDARGRERLDVDVGAVQPRRHPPPDALRHQRPGRPAERDRLHPGLRRRPGDHRGRGARRRPRTGGHAADAGAAGLGVPLPGRGARAVRGRRDRRAAQRQDPTFFRTGGTRLGRDGCRVPLPWTSDPPSFGFSPAPAAAPPHLPQPAWFADLSVERESGDDALEPRPSTSRPSRLRRELTTGEELTWVPSGPGVVHVVAARRVDVPDQLRPGPGPAARRRGAAGQRPAGRRSGARPNRTVWVRQA